MTMEAHFEALRAARSHQVMATAEVGRLERELQAKVLAGETTGAQVMDFAIGHGCGFAFAMTCHELADDVRAHAGELILKVARRQVRDGQPSGGIVPPDHEERLRFELARLGSDEARFLPGPKGREVSDCRLAFPTSRVAIAADGLTSLERLSRSEGALTVPGAADVRRHKEEGLLPGQMGWCTTLHVGTDHMVDIYVGNDVVTRYFERFWRGGDGQQALDPAAPRCLYRLATYVDDPLTATPNLRHLRDEARRLELEELGRLEARLGDGERPTLDKVDEKELLRALHWMDRFGLNEEAAVVRVRAKLERAKKTS